MEKPAQSELDGLMSRLANGDRSALEGVYRGLWGPVHAFCLRMLGQHDDAEDAAQKALLKLVGKAHEYSDGRSALTWALSIAAWECRTIRTTQRRRREVDVDANDRAADSRNPEVENIQRETLEAVRDVFGDLSDVDRHTLEKALAGQPMTATERKRKQRAIGRFRELLERIIHACI